MMTSKKLAFSLLLSATFAALVSGLAQQHVQATSTTPPLVPAQQHKGDNNNIFNLTINCGKGQPQAQQKHVSSPANTVANINVNCNNGGGGGPGIPGTPGKNGQNATVTFCFANSTSTECTMPR
jgi:hypothetical protein